MWITGKRKQKREQPEDEEENRKKERENGLENEDFFFLCIHFLIHYFQVITQFFPVEKAKDRLSNSFYPGLSTLLSWLNCSCTFYVSASASGQMPKSQNVPPVNRVLSPASFVKDISQSTTLCYFYRGKLMLVFFPMKEKTCYFFQFVFYFFS